MKPGDKVIFKKSVNSPDLYWYNKEAKSNPYRKPPFIVEKISANRFITLKGLKYKYNPSSFEKAVVIQNNHKRL